MPLLEISLWKGIDDSKKEKLVAEVTDVVTKIVECPKEAVHIILREEPRENWATGGIQHSRKFNREP
jgi:4-oxalocrotonate tautomerase